jgi:hypothetical protein
MSVGDENFAPSDAKISQANLAGALMLGSSLPATASVTLENASLLADVAKLGLSQAAVAVPKAASASKSTQAATPHSSLVAASSNQVHLWRMLLQDQVHLWWLLLQNQVHP